MTKTIVTSIGSLLVLSTLLVAAPASASHSWGGYHWARTVSPFTLKLGDDVSTVWDGHLAAASGDWSVSSVLDTSLVSGLTNPKNCRAVNGRVEVCNSKYGNNGWLGMASIWVSGNHITQGTVKLNDTYFTTTKYNTSAWRRFVTCQEIGHTFGLDHQDEVFGNPNLGTCMDYTNDPSTNQHPNQHDYDELAIIYTHLDSASTLTSSIDGGGKGRPAHSGQTIDPNDQSAWGKALRSDAKGRPNVFEKNIGFGEKVITHVLWAD